MGSGNRTERTLTVLLAALTIGVGISQPAISGNRLRIAEVQQGGGKPKFKGKVSKDIVEADDLLSKGDWAKAADAYHNAMNRDTKNPAAIAGYGMALGKQYKLD